MSDVFYRVETSSSEDFLAGPHISEPSEGAWLACPRCNGLGVDRDGKYCDLCDFTCMGQIEYDPKNPEHADAYRREGVSCFRTPDRLIGYFNGDQAVCPTACAEVVEFEGEATDIGLDEEPLAVPLKVLRCWTWAEFEKEFGEE